MRILTTFGTRPEAIKMAPVVHQLAKNPRVTSVVCVTGQHREMLTQALDFFAIKPDINLDIMLPNQQLSDVTARLLQEMTTVINEVKPSRVLVHGDTTTTFAATLAAYYAKIPVGHVEAGLRTYDNYAPWPEEANRRLTDTIADLFFAPTTWARQNLLNEGVRDDRIIVTGNTVVDALHWALEKIDNTPTIHHSLTQKFSFLDPNKRLILVTGHRRENFGEGIISICEALIEICHRQDVEIVYPVHPNPNIQKPVTECLSHNKNIFLLPPLSYTEFIYLMRRSHIIISDSGGIQEEAPSLGKPVLVTRDVTERPEAVAAGTVKLVSNNKGNIIKECSLLLDNQTSYAQMSGTANPYGDGTAAQKIIDGILHATR